MRQFFFLLYLHFYCGVSYFMNFEPEMREYINNNICKNDSILKMMTSVFFFYIQKFSHV